MYKLRYVCYNDNFILLLYFVHCIKRTISNSLRETTEKKKIYAMNKVIQPIQTKLVYAFKDFCIF